MSSVDDYLGLIPAANSQQPNFTATITTDVSTQVQVQNLMQSMVEPLFDVDTATGAQLDIIGQWVGFSRNVTIPVAGVFFTWDGTDQFVGWDFGVWQDPNQPTEITTLPDDTYRLFIRAKIAANHWDGTTDGAYAIWDEVFTDTTILIQDNLDMSYDLAIVGGIVDSLTLALITGGYLPLKPEGVRVNEYFIPVDTGPVFGFDLDAEFIQGWDEGSWAREISPS